jgi:hypothetical protein
VAVKVGVVPAQTELPDETVADNAGVLNTVLIKALETAVSPQASMVTVIVPEDNVEVLYVEAVAVGIATPSFFH